jgi:hypothetical protein
VYSIEDIFPYALNVSPLYTWSKECYPSDVVHDAWLRSLNDEKIRAAENWGPTPRVRIKPLR